jgi:hypothetical protein
VSGMGTPSEPSPSSFIATREILSSKPRTCSKPLLSERGDHEERRENESLRPRERKTLGMEGKGREKKDLIANCMYIDFVYLHDGIREQQL